MLALLATALLGVTAVACGGAGDIGIGLTALAPTIAEPTDGTAATIPSRIAPGSYLEEDGDKDGDDDEHHHATAENDNLALLATYGHEASPGDTRA